MFRSRKGQSWTIDYIISFLIFIIAAMIVIKILTNAFPTETFENKKLEASKISSHLVGTGSPKFWTSGTVNRLGVADEGNRINDAKLENFLELDYDDTKNYFGTISDYAFYFQRNNSILGFREECALGSPDLAESKSLYSELLNSAYYHRDDTFALSWMNTLGADVYDGRDTSEADDFYSDLDQYDFVLMENPHISDDGTLTTVVKKNRLEEYVRKGGELWLTGNVSTNLTGVGFSNNTQENGIVVDDADPYLELTNGATIEDDDSFNDVLRVVNINTTDYTTLATFNNSGTDFISRWNYGIGEGYYFSTIEATYKGGVTTGMENKVGGAAESYVNITKANCTSLDFNITGADDIAKIERFVIRDGDIASMVVLTW